MKKNSSHVTNLIYTPDIHLFGVSHNRELYQYTTNDPKVFEEALRMIREVC